VATVAPDNGRAIELRGVELLDDRSEKSAIFFRELRFVRSWPLANNCGVERRGGAVPHLAGDSRGRNRPWGNRAGRVGGRERLSILLSLAEHDGISLELSWGARCRDGDAPTGLVGPTADRPRPKGEDRTLGAAEMPKAFQERTRSLRQKAEAHFISQRIGSAFSTTLPGSRLPQGQVMLRDDGVRATTPSS
jgi:hypothetical protein